MWADECSERVDEETGTECGEPGLERVVGCVLHECCGDAGGRGEDGRGDVEGCRGSAGRGLRCSSEGDFAAGDGLLDGFEDSGKVDREEQEVEGPDSQDVGALVAQGA